MPKLKLFCIVGIASSMFFVACRDEVPLDLIGSLPRGVSEKVESIDRECEMLELSRQANAESLLVFADTAVEGDKPSWRSFASEQELEAFRQTRETFSIANAATIDGHIAFVTLTMFSSSGDWVKFVSHCYGKDGSLALATKEFRTFYGHFALVEKAYFDPSGNTIDLTKEYRDLKTAEPIEVEKEWINETKHLAEGGVYTKVSDLPFADLLRKQ